MCCIRGSLGRDVVYDFSPALGLSASIRVLCLPLLSRLAFALQKQEENAAPVVNPHPFRTIGVFASVSRRSGSNPCCWSVFICSPAEVPLLLLKCKSPVALLTSLLILLEK